MSSSLWGGGIGRAGRVNDDAGDGSWVAEAVGQRDTLIARCGCWRQAARARITWQRRGRGIADLFDAFRRGLVMLPRCRIGT